MSCEFGSFFYEEHFMLHGIVFSQVTYSGKIFPFFVRIIYIDFNVGTLVAGQAHFLKCNLH